MTGLIWFSFSFAYPQYLCSFFFTIVPSLLDLGFRTLTYPTNPPRSGVLSLLSEPSLSYLSKLTVLFVEVLMSDCSVRLVRGCFPRKTCPLVRRNCPDFLSGLRRPDCPVRLSFCPVLKRFRKSRPATNPAVNRGADLRRGGGESEAFTAASESGRAPCSGAHSATEQGARRSQHRDSARQGRAEHGIHLRSEAESGAMTGWHYPWPENTRREKYPIPRTRIQTTLSLN